jgi:hypothetical protein
MGGIRSEFSQVGEKLIIDKIPQVITYQGLVVIQFPIPGLRRYPDIRSVLPGAKVSVGFTG